MDRKKRSRGGREARVEERPGWKRGPGEREARVEGRPGWKRGPGGREAQVEEKPGWKSYKHADVSLHTHNTSIGIRSG